MAAIYIKNGMAIEAQPKCDSCMHAQILRGFRESEEIVYCNAGYGPPLVVPFRIYQCSSHMDRTRPTWKQMEDLAIDILPVTSTSAKPAGFRTVKDSDSQQMPEEEPEPATVDD